MASKKLIRVCSRGSLLARSQTEWLVRKLGHAHPGIRFEVAIVRTTGDDLSLSPRHGTIEKGIFTREIEETLLACGADMAVHSLKDLPTGLPDGLKIGAVPERADPRDALIGKTVDELAKAAGTTTIGTSSLRRGAQLRSLFPGCTVVDLRGNVDTRLRKVREGVVGSAVMAVAGIERLGRAPEITAILDDSDMMPAPGQGALAVEIRENDPETEEIVSSANCRTTATCTIAERAFLHRLGSGCRAPVAALATISGSALVLKGRALSLDGTRVFGDSISGRREEPEEIGRQLADRLLDAGAGPVLEQAMNEVSGS